MTPGQIGDYEQNNYTFRLTNGIQVQPYFSNADAQEFIVPDGSTEENFSLTPIYNTKGGFTNTYDLLVEGTSSPNNFTISSTTLNGRQELSITANGETDVFDKGYLRNVTLDAGYDGSVKLDGAPAGFWSQLTVSGTDVQVSYTTRVTKGAVQLGGTCTVIAPRTSSHNVTITSTQVTVDGNAPLQYVATQLTVDSSNATSTCNVQSTASSSWVQVIASKGSTITVGNGSVSGIDGYIALAGGGNLVVDDSYDHASHTDVMLYSEPGFMDPSYAYGFINNLAPAIISYRYLDTQSVMINGGDKSSPGNGGPFGNNRFYVNETGVPTVLNTGAGNDMVYVEGGGIFSTDANNSGSLDFIQAPLTIDGEGGTNNRLNVEDNLASGAEKYTITPATLDRTGSKTITYSHIQTFTLQGGDHGNDFDVRGTAVSMSLTIYTGTGTNTAVVGGNAGLKTLGGPLTVNGGLNTLTLNDQGSTSDNTYTLTATTLKRTGVPVPLITYTGTITTVQLQGGSGNNTLKGTGSSTWTINATNAGTWGSNVDFTGMQSLVAGSASDTFQFVGAGNITGSLTGGGTLDYSGLSTAVTVNLQTHTASQIGGTFSDGIGTVDGSSTATTNTLYAANTFNNWSILGTNYGHLNGAVVFSGIQNLVGGTGVDVFAFSAGGSVSSINSGGAPAGQGDWLDYSLLSTAVTVNLATGSATGVNGGAAGSVTNIQNVHGSYSSTLIGNAQGNILIGGVGGGTITGGTGRSLLISGGGFGTNITGGSGANATGGDILIGGTTSYDSDTKANLTALMAIFAEWQSADSYAMRFSKINTGAGPKLNYGTTVFDGSPGSNSTLIGATSSSSTPAVDWFFAGALDKIIGYEAGEHKNNT